MIGRARVLSVGQQQQRKYRAAWAFTQYKHVDVSKTQVKSYSIVNRNHGCYRPFGAIVQNEGGGGDAAAVRGAPIMALRCIKTGGEWASRNPSTEQLKLWHIKRETIEDFTEVGGMRKNARRSLRWGVQGFCAKSRHAVGAPATHRLAVPCSAGGITRSPNAIDPTVPTAAAPSITAPAAAASAMWVPPAAPCPAPPIAWPERVLLLLHMAGMSKDKHEPLVLTFDSWERASMKNLAARS